MTEVNERNVEFHDLKELVHEQSNIILTANENKVVNLEAYQDRPNRIRKEIEFKDLRGFLDYANDFKEETSACFAGEKIEIVFDYHKQGLPSHATHSSSYKMVRSTRWDLWKNSNDKWMAQEDFCDFLDSDLNEIVEPAQADVLALTKDFRATVTYSVQSKDDNNFTFTKNTTGGSNKSIPITLPEHLFVVVTPYKGLDVINDRIIKANGNAFTPFRLKAKLSWKVKINVGNDEQKLFFKYKLLNSEQLEDTVLEDLRGVIHTLTGINTYIS